MTRYVSVLVPRVTAALLAALVLATVLPFLATLACAQTGAPQAPPAGGVTAAAPVAAPPATAVAAAAEPAAPGRSPTLPHNLSPWGMFLAADIVVKAVMIGLAFASVVTWTVWIAKTLELVAAVRTTKHLLFRIAAARSLAEAIDSCRGTRSAVARLAYAAGQEAELSAGLPPSGVKERVQSRLERIEVAAGRRMTRGTGLLATIGATGPFVGLFGTVWGIMNAFIGISKAQTTNLAIVAPGIAEALLATAIGLVAAIPAVIIYNLFSRWIGGYRMLLADASAEILRHVSRDLDRGRQPASLRAAAE